MRNGICCIVLVCWAAGVAAVAQDPKTKAAGEPATAFRKLHAEFKELVARLKKIQTEYKEVRPEKRQALEDEFAAKRDAAEKVLPQLRTAAEAAMVADPTNDDLIDFLGALATGADERVDDAEALRLAELVLDNEQKARAKLQPPANEPRRPELHRIAARAAYHLTDLDKAEKHFQALEKYPAHNVGDVQTLRKMLPDEQKAWEAESKLRAAEAKEDNDPQALPRVKLETTKGDIVIELLENEVPGTVANFISLVESKFYDGKPLDDVSAETVETGRVAAGEQGLNYTIPFEATSKNARPTYRGSLYMLREEAGKDTAVSRFGIALRRFPSVDAKFDDKGEHKEGSTVFGRVVQGLDVLPKLQRISPSSIDVEPDRIIKASVVRKRNHAYVPKKITAEKTKPGDEKTSAEKGSSDKSSAKGKEEPGKDAGAADPSGKKEGTK
jgi:cyclophilin family peptidyl-prolyl cis-trans isomerase